MRWFGSEIVMLVEAEPVMMTTVYEEISEPPGSAGGAHETVAVVSPAVASISIGADGGPTGRTDDDCDDVVVPL